MAFSLGSLLSSALFVNTTARRNIKTKVRPYLSSVQKHQRLLISLKHTPWFPKPSMVLLLYALHTMITYHPSLPHPILNTLMCLKLTKRALVSRSFFSLLKKNVPLAFTLLFLSLSLALCLKYQFIQKDFCDNLMEKIPFIFYIPSLSCFITF